MTKIMDKKSLKKLSNDFNNWVLQDKGYDRKILIEHTAFFSGSVGARGPNWDESGLLNFGTKLIEANSVHFAGGKNTYSIDIYVNSTVSSHDRGVYVELRTNEKTYTFELLNYQDEIPHQLRAAIGKISEFLPEEYERFLEESKNVDAWQLESAFEKYVLDRPMNIFCVHERGELKEKLEEYGIKILVWYDYTHKISSSRIPHMGKYGVSKVGQHYVKQTKNSIELGWYASGTYNALPNVVRISKTRKMPTTRLCDISLEKRGYYDHHFKCEIPTTQVNAAKSFFKKRFGK